MEAKYGDDFIGHENPFAIIIPDVNKIMNFQIGIFTMTIMQLNESINFNLEKFQKDFMIENFCRIRDDGMEKCYVVISRLKLYWETSSIDNFINGKKKMKLIDGKRNGIFIWVGLKNVNV